MSIIKARARNLKEYHEMTIDVSYLISSRLSVLVTEMIVFT